MISWFEISVTHLSRAIEFYGSILQVQLKDMEVGRVRGAMFPYNARNNEISGTLMQGEGYIPSPNGGKIVVEKTKITDEIYYVSGYSVS